MTSNTTGVSLQKHLTNYQQTLTLMSTDTTDEPTLADNISTWMGIDYLYIKNCRSFSSAHRIYS